MYVFKAMQHTAFHVVIVMIDVAGFQRGDRSTNGRSLHFGRVLPVGQLDRKYNLIIAFRLTYPQAHARFLITAARFYDLCL